MKILHIVPDDKYIDDAIAMFDSIANVDNQYICLQPDNQSNANPFKYIKQTDKVKIVQPTETEKYWNDESVDMYAFHTLPESEYEYVLKIPNHKMVFWLSCGFDIYTASWNMKPIIPLQIYKPLTLKYIKDIYYSPTPTILQLIKRTIKYCINYHGIRDIKNSDKIKIKKKYLLRQSVISRIDYISTVLPIEYEMLSKIKGFKAKYIPFQYANRDDTLLLTQENTEQYILLGNSAICSNNHLDIIKVLKKRAIKNVIYMPMAYGDYDGTYIDYIKEHVKTNDNIILQEKYIPRQDYISMLSRCKVAIFGHIRQQSVGNILIAMQLGMKIYLYKDSICYKYFKQIGCKIYTIEHDLTSQAVELPLTDFDKNINRNAIKSLVSYEIVQYKLQNFFKIEFNNV